MIKSMALRVATLCALVVPGQLPAHHSIGMFELASPVWLSGTVVRFEPVNPHAWIEIEQQAADGRVQRWLVEGPGSFRFQRVLRQNGLTGADDFLSVGDVIEVCGFPFRRDTVRGSAATTGVTDSPPVVHGHILVMQDGRMQAFGPYGMLTNCLRPNDQAQTWADFLNRNPMAWEFWCRSRQYTHVASIARQALVDEVDGVIDQPCS